jgi:hypothetical protein
VVEAQLRLADLAEACEGLGRHVAVQVQVLGRGLQVLANGQQLHPGPAQVAHAADHLVVGFAHPDDDVGLDRGLRPEPVACVGKELQ